MSALQMPIAFRLFEFHAPRPPHPIRSFSSICKNAQQVRGHRVRHSPLRTCWYCLSGQSLRGLFLFWRADVLADVALEFLDGLYF